MSHLKTEYNQPIESEKLITEDNQPIESEKLITEKSEKLKTEDNQPIESEKLKTIESEKLKTEDDHSSLKKMLMNDINNNNFPDWFQFVDKYINKLVPPNVKAALTLLEVVDAVTENKDAIIATGKRIVEVKLKEKEHELDKIEHELNETKMIGGFTYEECVF
jgi:hypothetical protein